MLLFVLKVHGHLHALASNSNWKLFEVGASQLAEACRSCGSQIPALKCGWTEETFFMLLRYKHTVIVITGYPHEAYHPLKCLNKLSIPYLKKQIFQSQFPLSLTSKFLINVRQRYSFTCQSLRCPNNHSTHTFPSLPQIQWENRCN